MIHIKTNVIPHVTGLTEQKPIEVKSLRKKIKGYDQQKRKDAGSICWLEMTTTLT